MTDILLKHYRVPRVRGTRMVFQNPSVICHLSHQEGPVFYDKMLKRYRNSRNNSRNWELIYIFANKFSITMQIIFDDKDLEELITTGRNSKYKKYTRNSKFMRALATAYNYLRLSERASDLRSISFLHYEQLSGTNGLSSIRVVNGMVERIIFREFNGGIRITVLSLDDTHYGNKK